MQKVVQRAQRAQSRYESKRRKLAAVNHRIDTSIYVREQQAINTDRLSLIKSARERRKEDSRLGPLLAPRRDVNFEGKDKAYGTVSLRLLRGAEKPRREEVKDWGIREGDRVAVTERGNRDFGKVGVVREVRERAEDCFIKGVNLVCCLLSPFCTSVMCYIGFHLFIRDFHADPSTNSTPTNTRSMSPPPRQI